MRLQQMTLRNFYSYEMVDVLLGDQGLVLIKGENQDSSVMGSNGAGKSTLVVDAILWALFGKTPRNQLATEVVRSGSSGGCNVMLKWQEGDALFGVNRFQDDPK